MYDVTGHSEYTASGAPGRWTNGLLEAGDHPIRDLHTGGAGAGMPFTTMRAEEIFRQFFGGDFDFGSVYNQQDFNTSAHQVREWGVLVTMVPPVYRLSP